MRKKALLKNIKLDTGLPQRPLDAAAPAYPAPAEFQRKTLRKRTKLAVDLNWDQPSGARGGAAG
jgi:hypothetical protein